MARIKPCAVAAPLIAAAICACGGSSSSGPAAPTPTAVTADSFNGLWKNIDSATGSIPQLQIRLDADRIYVHGYGACFPTFCDWDEASASRADAATGTFKVTWNPGFSVKTLTLTLPASNGRLLTSLATHYTDNSGRTDYTVIDSFNKSS